MTRIGKLLVQIGVDFNKWSADMTKINKSLNASVNKMTKELKGLERSFAGVNQAAKAVTVGFAGMFLVQTAAGVLMTADSFNQLKAKMKNAVDESTNVDDLLKKIADSSGRTGVSIDSVAQAFVRLRPAAVELGLANDTLIQFSETFQKMGALSGATSEELSYTMIQLAQGIAANRLGGEELRSVLEQMPSVARAIADTMKIPMSSLKDVAKEGKITADVVFDAILGKTKEVDEQFKHLPPSIQRSITTLSNTFNILLGDMNQTTSATTFFAKKIDEATVFLQKHRAEILVATKVLLQFGEKALQVGSVAWNTAGTVVNAIMSGMNTAVNAALRAVDFMINGAIGKVNQLIGVLNNIPGVKLGKMGQVKTPGIDMTGRLAKLHYNDMAKTASQAWIDADKLRLGISDIGPLRGSGFGTSTMVKSPFTGGGGGGGGKGGKGKKQGKSEAEKELERLKDEAKSLTDSMRTPWEVSAEEIQKADKLLKLHLISYETYQRAVNDAQMKVKEFNPIHQSLSKDLDSMFDKMFKPLEETFDNINTEITDDAFRAVQQVVEDTLTPLERYNREIANLEYLHKNAGLSAEVFQRAVKKADEDLKAATKSGNDFSVAIGNVVAQFGDRFFDTFVEGLKNGKMAFKDFALSAIEDISKLIFKMTVTIPLANAIVSALGGNTQANTGSSKGSIGGSFLGSIGKIVGGGIGKIFGFAEGGDVPGGRPIIAGENGPELFWPGMRGGYMQPNHALAGGGGMALTQYITINTIDNRGFEDRLAENAKFLGNMAVQAVQRQSNRFGKRGPTDR